MAAPLDAVAEAHATILYALSTLAQTCAALAAFVGALGIFRLQRLRDDQAALERVIRTARYGVATNADSPCPSYDRSGGVVSPRP